MDGFRLNDTTVDLFEYNRRKRKAITFDEVTFEDRPSTIHPNDVTLETKITTNITLKLGGIMSAAMDTVTGKELALAMAKMGSIGILHRNMSPEEQAQSVKWVRNKIHFGGMIENPITYQDTQYISDIETDIKNNGWTFTNFPILNNSGKLIGMVSRNELEFVEDSNPKLSEIMIPLNKVVMTNKINKHNAYSLMKQHKVKKLPVVNDDDKFLGMYAWNDVCRDEEKRNLFSLDKDGHFLVGAAVGVGQSEHERINLLVESGCQLIVIDTSHGGCTAVVETLDYIKGKYGNVVDVMVGNIASYDSAKFILENAKFEPDALKVGVSVGSICTTRRVTAHGMPQLTAIYNVWSYLNKVNKTYIPIIADGGVKYSGDIVKALAVGASGVMMGNVFAGTEESPGKTVISGNIKYKMVRGMGSRSAMEERTGSRMRYFDKTGKTEKLASNQKSKLVPEGVEGLTKIRGTVESVVRELSGGVRIGLAHSGATDIHQFRKSAKIWVQSAAGINEGNPHSLEKIIDQ